MKVFKNAVSVLTYICIVVIILYIICSLPLIAGLKPMPVTDDHLGKSFPAGSLFYYGKADISELEKGYAIVYKDGSGDKKVGIIKGTDGEIVTAYMKITVENGENKGSVEVPISYGSVLGINKTSNLPLVGGFYSFISGHVFVIILIGLIFVLRIALIYVDPEKLFKKAGGIIENSSDETKENDLFANIFAGKNVPKKEDNDVHSIFSNESDAEKNTVETSVEPETVPENAPEIRDIKVEPITEAAPVISSDKNPASEITDYINELTFDSKDDDWYSASQVDEALDVITSKVYDALNKAKEDQISEGELRKLRDDKAEIEKKYLIAEAELASANDRIAECEKVIEGYKEMEKKVAKLLAALKAEKKNG